MTTVKMLCSLGSLGLAVGVAGAGCWRYAQSHCGNHDGDETCLTRGAGTYCDLCAGFNDGCTDQMPSEGCLFVDGGVVTLNGEDGSTGGTTGGGTTAGGVTGSYGEASAEATTLGVSDGGDATTETGVELPCVSDDQCSGTTPNCDAASGTCVECSDHAHCGVAACNFFTGACLSAQVVHVGPSQSYDRLEDAVASFTMGTALEGTIIVHANGNSAYSDTVVVDGGRTIAFIPFAEDHPVWRTDDEYSPSLAVMGADAVAILDGLTLRGTSEQAPGIRVTNAGRAWVDRSRVIKNEGGGVVVDNAEVVLRNCFIAGIDDSGDYMLEGEDSNALEVVNGGTARVLYSTLAAGFWDAAALSCTSPGPVAVRNSIIVAYGNPHMDRGAVDIDCDGKTVNITYTATESGTRGTSNRALGQMPVDFFVGDRDVWFDDYDEEDFHLQDDGIGAFTQVAQWKDSDPLTDIDGDHRSNANGVFEHAGADRP